jgi:dienelactone hydrolase
VLTAGRIALLVLAISFLVALEILAAQQRGGPLHLDFDLPNNEPATLYLPGNGKSFYEAVSISPPPATLRPPGVVVIHGYAADRLGMSTLARRIARNGYGVLAIDLHGHGANRNSFSQGFAERDVLYDDVKNAVDYLRASQLVDASRIVVLGHSMGAGVALDYANRDPNIAGSVMVSGGWVAMGSRTSS